MVQIGLLVFISHGLLIDTDGARKRMEAIRTHLLLHVPVTSSSTEQSPLDVGVLLEMQICANDFC